jgi:hypothetical protein
MVKETAGPSLVPSLSQVSNGKIQRNSMRARERNSLVDVKREEWKKGMSS